jgi:chromosome segregation ATPase
MEFILEQQARFEGNFAKLERLVAQNNHLVARLARAGVALRSDVGRGERAIARHEQFLARHKRTMAEIEDKVNGLIDIVDKQGSDVRRHEQAITRIEENLAEVTRAATRTEKNLAEVTRKLEALIDFVNKQSRKNGAPED